MSVAAIGAVGGSSGAGAVYALSPYLNGVVRTPDAVAAAQAAAAASALRIAAASAASTAAAALAAAAATAGTASTPLAAPYANPAIAQIGEQTAIAMSLSGDAGLLVQSYGAVALATSPLALAPVFTQPAVPLTPPVAPIPPVAPVSQAA